MIKTIHFYGKIVALVLALAILGFLFPAQYTHAETIYGGNTASPITGVTGSSTVAIHTSEATLFSGENQTLNRMMILVGQQCISTTTDAQIKTGAGIISTYWISQHAVGDITIDLYDGTSTNNSLLNRIGNDYVASTSAQSGMTRWGGEFATGAYLDITGVGTTTICYR